MRSSDRSIDELRELRGRDRNQVTRLQIAKDFVLAEVLRAAEGWREKARVLKEWNGRGDIPEVIDPCATKPSPGIEFPGGDRSVILAEVRRALELSHGLAIADRNPSAIGLCEAVEIVREMMEIP